MQSQDIRRLVREEGKSARNLVAWSVPVVDTQDGFKTVTRKNRQRSTPKKSGSSKRQGYHDGVRKRAGYKQDSHSKVNEPMASRDQRTPLSGLNSINSTHHSSTGSKEECVATDIRMKRETKSPGSRVDLRARYWCYLFDNLHRAVDEIYITCEADESAIECQEVIMTLELCQKDFVALIQRFRVFEQQELQARPSNLAWEVRKTTSPTKLHSQGVRRSLSPHQSPSHHRHTHVLSTVNPEANASNNDRVREGAQTLERNPPLQNRDCEHTEVCQPLDQTSISCPAPAAQVSRPSARSLNFSTCSGEGRLDKNILLKTTNQDKCKLNTNSKQKTKAKLFGTGAPTWADKVKGVSPVGRAPRLMKQEQHLKPETKEEQSKGQSMDDNELEEGWERVTRTRSRSVSSCSKCSRSHQSVSTTRYSQKDNRERVSHAHNRAKSVSDSETETHNNVKNGRSETPTLIKAAKETTLLHSKEPVEVDTLSRSDSTDSIVVPKETVSIDSGSSRMEDSDDQNIDTAIQLNISDVHQGDEGTTERSESDELELSQPKSSEAWSWSDVIADYKAGESYRQEMSWADRCESPPDMLPETPRSPGRAIHLHQRLSSPSRRRPPVEDVEESRRIQDEKQAKAQLHRSRIQEQKSQKYKIVSDKVRDARQSRDDRIRQRREALEDKLQKAEVLRESHLQEIIRKAQEEETKVSEISFINTLEAQNKKMEVLERYQLREARLQELQDERQRKRDEQLAKEEAAQERRRALELERITKLTEQEMRRREQEAKIEQMKQERERTREDIAREKARERERKIEARNAAIQTSVEELERKIQLKHDESSRRYDQQLEQKKMVAVSVSRHTSSDDAPRVEIYQDKKWCTLCNVEIISEVYLLSHLRGRKHLDAVASLPSGTNELDLDIPVITDAPKVHQVESEERCIVHEKVKLAKKRAKKIRRRICARAKEEVWSSVGSPVPVKTSPKLQKALKELNRQLDAFSTSTSSSLCGAVKWEQSQVSLFERSLGEMTRCLAPGSSQDRLCFCRSGGVASVVRFMMLCMLEGGGKGQQKQPPLKALQQAVSVLELTCTGHVDNCRYLILSAKTAPLIDMALQLLSQRLSGEVGVATDPRTTPLCGSILGLLASVISTLASNPNLETQQELTQPLMDIISYMVSVGLVDSLSDLFSTIIGPIPDVCMTQLVLSAINLIVATTAYMHIRVVDVFSEKPSDDSLSLTLVLHQTELGGLMQLLYAILLHDGPPRHSSTPPPLTQHTLAIARATITAINNCSILSLHMVQACLGAEGVSLEFRHIVSYLLWYCSHNNCTSLLHELILAVGYFSVLNKENQVFLQCGRSPTLLQLLCHLPFQYFSNPDLSYLLYPTLISACYQVQENVIILEQEISCKLLVTFLQENCTREVKTPEATKPGIKNGHGRDFNTLASRFPRLHWEEAIKFFSR